MGAKVIILAKSLIPTFLRACAIVQCVGPLEIGNCNNDLDEDDANTFTFHSELHSEL